MKASPFGGLSVGPSPDSEVAPQDEAGGVLLGAAPEGRRRLDADRLVVRRAVLRLRVGRLAAGAGVALAAPAADAGFAADAVRLGVDAFFLVADFLLVDDALRVEAALVDAGFATEARLRVDAAFLAGFALLVDLLDAAAFRPLDAADAFRVLPFAVRDVFFAVGFVAVARRFVARRAGRFLPTGNALTNGLTTAPLRRRRLARTADAAPS